MIKAALVALLAVASVGVGAFVMPALNRDGAATAGSPDSDRTPAVPPSTPVVATPAFLPANPAAPVADPTRGPVASAAAPPAGPSRFDVPRVAPQLPSNSGAYAVARKIDAEINGPLKEAGLPLSPLAGDAEFLRRVCLDLTGKVPTRERTIAFLDDSDPAKRAKLIDELLAGRDHGVFFARIWADLLVKRDFDTNRGLDTAPFVAWLAERFNSNAGWDRTVTELVTASGQEQKAPATFFVMANQDNKQPSPPKLVGAVGNLFMGVQIQCAECHQHPFTAKWGQNDFWGMAAFFGHTKAQRAGDKKKATGPATITEVESAAAPRNKKGAKTGPAIAAGLKINVPDPNDPRKIVKTAPGRFFEGGPASKAKGPYRPMLAAWLTSPQNRYFARATVNRVWAHFFARGLVNPVEDMNPENKPTHPRLLRDLAEGFAESKFDLKQLMRAVCNSEAYQRTSRPLADNKSDEKLYSHMPVKVITAQQLIDSLAVVTGRQAARPAAPPAGKKGQGKMGGDLLVRAFDTREYDDDATEFSYGIPQLLKLMNTQLTIASGQVARELAARHRGDHARVIEDVYLTALSRRPTQSEAARMIAHVEKAGPGTGYADVMWALLNCAEFISNH